jgi:signal recognition particle GTPase
MGQKVKKINEALDEIQKDAARFGLGLTSLSIDRAQEVSWDPDRETDSFLDSSEVVGREDDVSNVVELLTSLTKHQHVLSVVPIVGMAGLGKTTVAKKFVKW